MCPSLIYSSAHHSAAAPPAVPRRRSRLYEVTGTENVILFVTDDPKESETQSLSPGRGGERLQLPNSKPAALFNVPSGG